MKSDLSFEGADTSYSTHSLHAFAAKFPPPLPRLFIEKCTRAGEWVLDPMAGSGTALVEAALLGRNGIGLDIDPLARIISTAKTSIISVSELRSGFQKVINRAVEIKGDPVKIDRQLTAYFGVEELGFLDYWFLKETQRDLFILKLAIEQEKDTVIQKILWTAFSSVIVTKSGGVSQAMDLAHTRPHKVPEQRQRDAWELFRKKASKFIEAFESSEKRNGAIIVVSGDSRALPLADSSVDLIITSPPYANAIDYMRAHKFSLVWMGAPLSKLRTIRAEAIGSERNGRQKGILPDFVNESVATLETKDQRKAHILKKYFQDMQTTLREMKRVLKADRAIVMVIGPSIMRCISIPTHLCMEEIGKELGFKIFGNTLRPIARNRRLMPARFKTNELSMIEQRMHEEYVLAFWKEN